MVSAAADGRARWRTDFDGRCNIEVFEIFCFFNITIEIARAYGKFSNLNIVEVMCMHLSCMHLKAFIAATERQQASSIDRYRQTDRKIDIDR